MESLVGFRDLQDRFLPRHRDTPNNDVPQKGEQTMRIALVTTVALLFQCAVWAGEISTFRAYIDTDLCSRLMFGPITPSRIGCSQKTAEQKAEPVLVQLNNNMIFAVNKQKLLQPLVSQFAEATGEAKAKSGSMKLQAVKPIKSSDIPAGDPDRKLLDVRPTEADSQIWEKVRHELAMVPYMSEFDFISFNMSGTDVILTGWTVRSTNRSDADYAAKKVPGVGTVINNIEILPVGSFDMDIRARTRANLQRMLSRYFWRTGSDIKIVVKYGQVILLGRVASKSDYDIANIQANSVPGAFKVYNLLQVQNPEKK
jgi:hyperosmotically inducible periplasmic protein